MRLVEDVAKAVVLRQSRRLMGDAGVLRPNVRQHWELRVGLTVLLPARRLAPLLSRCQYSKARLNTDVTFRIQAVFEYLLRYCLPGTWLRRSLDDRRGIFLHELPTMLIDIISLTL